MRRKLGQHFLASTRILERIASAACPPASPDATGNIVEIGPGRGALTEPLLARVDRTVIAIEMDPALAAGLRARWPDEPRLQVVEGNALNFDWTQWGPGVLTGNLPYYVATAMISKYLARPGALRHAVFLIQKEVAERITAKPGARDFGYLSVECQYLAKADYLFSVPPGAFRPPPQVDSAVIRLTPRPEAALNTETPAFLRFASACFRQKRKTLRNNLAELYPKEILDSLPAPARRAEQLSVAELLDLFRALALEHGVVDLGELRPYRDAWTADDPHAGFKADVAAYTSVDPLPTLANLSSLTGIPVECLIRYVLVKYAASGADALLAMRPLVFRQIEEHVAAAERENTEAARLRAYAALKSMLEWLGLGDIKPPAG